MDDEFAGSDEEEEESDEEDDDDDDDSDDDGSDNMMMMMRCPVVLAYYNMSLFIHLSKNRTPKQNCIYCVYFQLPIEKKSKKLLKKQKKEA